MQFGRVDVHQVRVGRIEIAFWVVLSVPAASLWSAATVARTAGGVPIDAARHLIRCRHHDFSTTLHPETDRWVLPEGRF